jgi:2-haloacid dehalogenase
VLRREEAMTIRAIVFDAYGTLFDVLSVDRAVEAAFPGYGAFITQVWRMKQLEYSWLRSLMNRYEDFKTVTRESLAYTLGTLGRHPGAEIIDELVSAYDRLTPYPDAAATLASLSGHQRAILSNGSPGMLDTLVANAGLERSLEAVISVDAARAFKPDPRAYALVELKLGVRPDETFFVSSNGFDVSGAKAFGFTVARIERITPEALAGELTSGAGIAAPGIFKALRTQIEGIGFPPDYTLSRLSDLAGIVAGR